MRIEVVIVCHNYSDFLAETLPRNISQVDRLVVMTHPSDTKTKALCSKYSAECFSTEEMHKNNDKFNKGRVLNLGMAHLRGWDWFLLIDADIVLPHRFKAMLEKADLMRDAIYGADRCNVYGWDHWQDHKDKIEPHYSDRYFIQPPKEFPLGARIVHSQFGYCPIGYFQLFHSSQHKRYHIEQGTGEHSDVLFATQWPRDKRILLPEVFVYHLESPNAPTPIGANWQGRTTPEFGPHAMAELRHGYHHHHHHHHHHPHHPHKPHHKKEK